MKKLTYNRSLKEDLKTVNKEGKKIDIILTRILNDVIAIICSLPILFGFNKLMSWETNWVVSITTLTIIDTVSAIRLMLKDIKEREQETLKAEYKIGGLINEINRENEDAINIVPEITVEGIKEAIAVKEEETSEEYIAGTLDTDGHKKKTKTITTNFFFLDTADKLRVLREIRKEIKENGNEEVYRDLYLLDDEDIPRYVPVVKTLERK